jgi:hypothetical protein
LGVFDALSGRTISAAELAAALGADLRGLELLLNTAAALGWLEKRDGQFSNSALAENHLTSSGMGRSLRLESAFYHRWATWRRPSAPANARRKTGATNSRGIGSRPSSMPCTMQLVPSC